MALLSAGVALSFASAGQPDRPRVQAIGSDLTLTLPDGRVLGPADLVGAVLSIDADGGGEQAVRIDAVEDDPDDPAKDIRLYSLSVRDPASGAWSPFCLPGPDGVAKAFPLSGRWTADGRHVRDEAAFSLICTGGAIGKCVRWGYKPWRASAKGADLWDAHQACVRMVRADYAGDGVGHTRDDTPIDLFDRLGINLPAGDPGGLTFEAAWGPDGAVCVRKTRYRELMTLEALERAVPALRGHTGEACREDVADPRVLVLNRS
ncbi:ADYC domain-containing protein [Alsobacter sp. SYSU M60028]|uniref:ADYC domain-containing protein n=1 Tax=Alsobacter ponti TaxID=2962936 RepID=A0ABT1LKW7_9HYPH|nr:ADYC domain-containing protein [Alsobacter ponti]MCP8940893.1 ADYC domain-containing protein [Alsobacter ponti]